MSDAELLEFINAGGFAAQAAPTHGAEPVALTAAELLSISETAVKALLGLPRAAVLRIDDTAMQRATNSDFKNRNAQMKQMQLNGQSVPSGFCRPMLFFTFQFDRDGLLSRSPVLIRELEYWAYLYGKWAVKEASDMSNAVEFRDVASAAALLAPSLNALTDRVRQQSNTPVPSTLRSEVFHVLQRFSTVRLQYIKGLCDRACDNQAMQRLHDEFKKIHRAYAHDNRTLERFMNTVDKLIATQSVSRGGADAQEGYCTLVFLAWVKAFLSGLQGGAAPPDKNPLDDPVSSAGDSIGATGFPTRSPLPQAPTLFSTLGTIATPAPPPPPNPWLAPPPPIYTTIQQPALGMQAQDYPTAGLFSLENMVRQTAAGFRDAGALVSPGGGAAQGIDLTTNARRVLWAHQLATGLRAAGHLIAMPPDGDLPPLSSYPMPYAPPLVAVTPPPVTFAAPATAQLPRYDRGPRPPPRNTDDLAVPFSSAMLGQYSPYRSARPQGQCFECNGNDGHFALECPARFARIKGEAPPGWRSDGLGRASKNPAEWSADLSDLTDVARAGYRAFIQRFALIPANLYPTSVDEITGAQPPAQKRPLYSIPRGGGVRP
jgi:hypothetical protein